MAFEDLMSKQVSLTDIRAYVLVRQTALGPEDRKKIILDNQGKLTYETARKSLRLLGSKFFQELQGGRGGQTKEEEQAHQVSTETSSLEMDEDQAIQALADQRR